MSFVGKALKKVFKVVKKVVKSKWFKIALIIAASVFTAGVAAGGFAAFSGVSTVGGFFGAVGTTMGTGYSAIIGAVGLGGAAAAPVGAGASGAAATTAAGSIGTTGAAINAGGVIGTGTVGMGATGIAAGTTANISTALGTVGAISTAAPAATMASAIGSAVTVAPAVTATAGTFLTGIGKALTADTIGGSMLRTGLVMGINGYIRGKENEQAKFYYENRTVWGEKAFGGSADSNWDLLKPIAGSSNPTMIGQDQMTPQELQAQGILTPQESQQQTQQLAGQQQQIQQGADPNAAPMVQQEQPGILQQNQEQLAMQQRPMGGVAPEQLGVV